MLIDFLKNRVSKNFFLNGFDIEFKKTDLHDKGVDYYDNDHITCFAGFYFERQQASDDRLIKG